MNDQSNSGMHRSGWYETAFAASVVIILTLASLLCRGAKAADELAQPASWAVLSPQQIRAAVEQWLGPKLADAGARQQFEALWPKDNPLRPGLEPLDQIAATIATFDEQSRPLVELCRGDVVPAPLPQFGFLADPQTPAFVRNHLRLLYARWLSQHNLFDEAGEMMKEMSAADVCDPALLYFYQAITYHRLMRKDECGKAVNKLLENESVLPRRYVTVARLAAADIEPLAPDSLDEISRLMGDIQRRLQLSRAGRQVRQQEEDVIAKLDKMIKEAEQKQQQMQAAAQSGNQSSSPAEDSTPAGGRGPGDVDQKRVGETAGWGNLPPKQREEALQQMSKDLPAHYRELIEEYFRKLARDGSR